MSKDPAFLFYSSDFITGITFMSNEDVGIYIRLLCYQHQHGGIIDKEDFLSMTENKPKVIKKFIETDDGYYNERLMTEMVKRNKKSKNLSLNALKRWKSNANAMQLDMPTEDEDENEVVNKTKKTTPRKKAFDFESVWEKHPKKIGKKEALGYFNTTVKSEEDFNNCVKAVDKYRKYVSDNNIEAKYIKSGCNWFDSWEDWVNYEEEKPPSKPVRASEEYVHFKEPSPEEKKKVQELIAKTAASL